MPEYCINDVRPIVEDVTKTRPNDELSPPMDIRPGSRKQGIDYGWQCLQDAVVCLEHGHHFLHFNLLLLVVVDVVADLLSVVQVYLAYLKNEKLLKCLGLLEI